MRDWFGVCILALLEWSALDREEQKPLLELGSEWNWRKTRQGVNTPVSVTMLVPDM